MGWKNQGYKKSMLFPGFVQIKIVILQVFVQAILALKGRHQGHSKLAEAHNL